MKNNKELSHKDISGLVEDNWTDLPLSKDRNDTFRESFKKKFYNYYRDAKERYSEIVAIEESFSYIDDHMILKGKVDLIAKDKNGETMLIDFKSRASEGIDKTNVEKQLQIYNHCLDPNFSIDKLVAYAFFDNAEIGCKKEEEGTKSFLRETSEKMQQEHFEKKPSGFCKQCQFNFHCLGS